jgi:hypothetical protein
MVAVDGSIKVSLPAIRIIQDLTLSHQILLYLECVRPGSTHPFSPEHYKAHLEM